MIANFSTNILAGGGLVWRAYKVQWDKSSEEKVDVLQDMCGVPMSPQGNVCERKRDGKI
jgi:hypothetical protein